MLTATQSHRIERYLAELAAALSDLPEPERTEVVAGIGEHIDAALGGRADVTDTEVEQVLRDLGDPLAIAATATADGDRTTSAGDGPVPAAAERRVPVLSRDWVPGAVVAALLVGPLVLPLFVSFGGMLLLPVLMLAAWAVLWMSPLWTVWEKLAGTVALPALGAVLLLSLLVTGSVETCTSDGTSEVCTTDESISPVVFWLLLAAGITASIAAAVVLYQRGRRRAADAAAAAQSFSTGA